jgi:hypothetical protein
MSLRYEQYDSLTRTRDFLRSLLSPGTRPKTVKELRENAGRCLRHFPALYESGQPMWSQDDFTKDLYAPRDRNVDYSGIVGSCPPGVVSSCPPGVVISYPPEGGGGKKCRP